MTSGAEGERARTFVYFDAGGTLFSPHPSVGGVYAKAGREHGLTASTEALDTAFRSAWKRRIDDQGREAIRMGGDEPSARAWWRALVDDVLAEVGYAGDRDRCFSSFFDAFEAGEAWRVFDDVLPTLEALRARGVGMGILSNWDYRLSSLLRTLDLERYFDPILISSREGLAKPDPRFFTLACTRAAVRPEQVLYVGDHRRLDLEPARELGIRAYLIDRTAPRPSGEVVGSLTELVALLSRPT